MDWTDEGVWTMVGAVATTFVSAGALIYAERHWLLLRLAHSPALRLAPAFIKGTNLLDPTKLLIKNVGRGAAIGVFLVDEHGAIVEFANGGTALSVDQPIRASGATAPRVGKPSRRRPIVQRGPAGAGPALFSRRS